MSCESPSLLVCPVCGEPKPVEAFCVRGLRYCRACRRKAVLKRYIEKNHARRLQQQKAYRERHKEKLAEYQRQKRRADPKRHRQIQNRYYAKNAAKVRATSNAWRARNRERFNAMERVRVLAAYYRGKRVRSAALVLSRLAFASVLKP